MISKRALIFFLTHAPYDYWNYKSDEPNLDEDNGYDNGDNEDVRKDPEDSE